jgi:hypothetical protein
MVQLSFPFIQENPSMSKPATATAAPATKKFPFNPPKEFKRIGQPSIDGWFAGDPGTTIQGQLVGLMMYEGDDGKVREHALIQLSVPCPGKDASTKEVRKLEAGEVLALGLNKGTKDLKAYVAHQGKVYLLYQGKKDIGGGRTYHEFDCSCIGERSTPPAPTVDNGDDDIHF